MDDFFFVNSLSFLSIGGIGLCPNLSAFIWSQDAFVVENQEGVGDAFQAVRGSSLCFGRKIVPANRTRLSGEKTSII